MNYTINTVLITAIMINMTTLTSQKNVIRHATLKDLREIQNICSREHHNGGFKAALTTALNTVIPPCFVTREFIRESVNEFIKFENRKSKEYIRENEFSDNKRLLVAYAKT